MENERLSGKDTREDNVEGNVEAKPKKVLGLTTKVALDTLHRDVGRVLQEYEEDHRRRFRKYRSWLKDSLHHRSQYTTLCWTSAFALLINAVILMVAFFALNET